jgi:signal transduction histidine kinase
MTLVVGLVLVLLGTTFWNTIGALAAYDPGWGRVAETLGALSKTSLFVLLFVFPDGRFVPPWTRYLAGAVVLGVLLEPLLSGSPLAISSWPVPLFLLFLLVLLVSGVHAQVHRYRRTSGPDERLQTKWVVTGLVSAVLVFLVVVLVGEVLTPWTEVGTPGELVAFTLVTLGMSLVPLSIGVAVLRHRLFDIDLLINRGLVYVVLTSGVVATYVVVVGYLGTLFRTDENLLISLGAAGMVAVAFAPLRELVQRGVNHLMYGERDDPYTVLSRLGARLETTVGARDVLPVAVTAVAEALKIPYVAVEVFRDGAVETMAETGVRGGATEALPVTHRGEPEGRLVLGLRAGELEFAPADRRLLGDLVRQVGVAVHTVRLAEDLQRSRERLVTLREEERRRLRRDLHDGLGPQLAALTMRAEAARELVGKSPERADEMLEQLVRVAHEAVDDVRRVVDELRPPALDALGLVGALRAATSHSEVGGLRVDVLAPGELPALPAAVEVAAYRIVLEAVHNAARHARATACDVRLQVSGEGLEVTVSDDGRGFPAPTDRGHGVGLGSMRERVEELGGRLSLGRGPTGGARVAAWLPIGRRG